MYDRDKAKEDSRQTVRGQEWIPHPKYNLSDGNYFFPDRGTWQNKTIMYVCIAFLAGFDIGLGILEKPLTITAHVRCLNIRGYGIFLSLKLNSMTSRYLDKAYPFLTSNKDYLSHLHGREVWVVGMGYYRWLLGTCELLQKTIQAFTTSARCLIFLLRCQFN